ncbi:MAG TPA: DUF6796 family protein [Thermoanaerobaculia bacterium]|nr:DUF6796 family protein [Thermoanaerobaculia bacterium]
MRWVGIVAIVAAAVAVYADLMLQYTPQAAHLGSRDYLYLLDVSARRLLIGHFVGVVAVLLEIAGFWQIAQGLLPAGAGKSRAFFLLGAFTFGVGAAFHAMFASIGLALQALRDAGGSTALLGEVAAAVRPAHEGLGVVTVLGIAALSIFFSAVVGLKKTMYPRWLAWFNPLAVALVLTVAGRLSIQLRLVLLPCSLNLANLLLFALSTLLLWNRTVEPSPVP